MYLRNILRKQALCSLTKFTPRSELQNCYLFGRIAPLIDSKSFSTGPPNESISQRSNFGKNSQSFLPNTTEDSGKYDSGSGSEQDAAINEFLSRFVWIMRGKLAEAYPDSDKNAIDMMLMIIVEKVVLEMERSGLEAMAGGNAYSLPEDFSRDLWETVWEVSNVVLSDMHSAQKKEKMKVFLQSEEVKEMCRFAGEIGIRGDMLRELRFKWAREKMEESEFYEKLERLGKDEAEYFAQQQGGSESRARAEMETVSEADGNVDVAAENSKLVSLPKRHGKINYKIYGLDLSDTKWAEVANRIHDAEELVGPQEPKPLLGNAKLVNEKIFSLKEEDDPSSLLAEWIEVHKPSRIDWNSLLEKLKEKNSPLYFKIAELVLSEESFLVNIRDYGKLLDAFARENKIEDAERIIAKMHEHGIMPDTIISSITTHMYCKAGNLEKAEKEFKELINQKILPDVSLYKSMIMAYVQAGMLQKAENLMSEMDARDIKPGKEIYMAILRSYASSGNVRGVDRITNTMQFGGIEADLESCTLLVEAYGRAGNPNQAKYNFDYMIKLGIKPDDRCTAGMIRAYERQNLLDKALGLLLQLEKDGFEPGVATYTVMVDWLSKLQLVDEVEQLLNKMAQLGETPPFDIHISLCEMYSQAGIKQKALNALSVVEAKKDQLGADGFERIIYGLISGGLVQDAERLLGLMESQGFTAPETLGVKLASSRLCDPETPRVKLGTSRFIKRN